MVGVCQLARITAALFGAFVGLWLSRALFKWILDVEGTLLIVLIAAGAVIGAAICVAGEIESRPSAATRRTRPTTGRRAVQAERVAVRGTA